METEEKRAKITKGANLPLRKKLSTKTTFKSSI
jgi:hypothetical protein